jgi:ferredoxin
VSAAGGAGAQAGRRISILYFSGTGGTAMVAELLGDLLSDAGEVAIASIHDARARALARDPGFLVLCYPTYFLRPAPSMRRFVATLGPFELPRAAYVVTTYELYPENSIRACASTLKDRGLIVTGSRAIRSPGSDVTCMLPGWACPWLYRFGRSFPRVLRSVAGEIAALSRAEAPRESVPGVKWYTPLARVLQVLVFDRFTGRLGSFRVLPDRCTLCGQCVAACHRGALSVTEGSLGHDPDRCELCMRCIHNCPNRAIVLAEALKDNPRLDGERYASLRESYREEAGRQR